MNDSTKENICTGLMFFFVFIGTITLAGFPKLPPWWNVWATLFLFFFAGFFAILGDQYAVDEEEEKERLKWCVGTRSTIKTVLPFEVIQAYSIPVPVHSFNTPEGAEVILYEH